MPRFGDSPMIRVLNTTGWHFGVISLLLLPDELFHVTVSPSSRHSVFSHSTTSQQWGLQKRREKDEIWSTFNTKDTKVLIGCTKRYTKGKSSQRTVSRVEHLSDYVCGVYYWTTTQVTVISAVVISWDDAMMGNHSDDRFAMQLEIDTT